MTTDTYTDPRLLATTYVRNGFGEVIQRVSPDTGTTTYTRDGAGRITQITDARGIVTNYTFDDAGRKLTRTYPAATSENVTYTYDSTAGGNKGVGRLTSLADASGSTAYTYDARGNVIQVVRTIGALAHTVSYVYDLADRLTEITYPSGRQVRYVRDAQGRITAVDNRKISTDPWAAVASDLVYQPMSRLVQSMSFANGLSATNTWTLDHELARCELADGATPVLDKSYVRGDSLNLTAVNDNLAATNNQTFAYTTANRLSTADGPWGARVFTYDGVGNRTQHTLTPPGGSASTEVLGYGTGSNRIVDITVGGSTTRQFVHDARGNITSDTRLGSAYTYTYNHANRLATVAFDGNLRGTYTYNGAEQLVVRVVTNMGTANGTTHFVHDLQGNVIAETDGTGAAGTTREYIYVPGIGYAGLSLPLATVDGVNTASPALYHVHTDHLSRPIMMTDATKANVWSAVWNPWGGVHSTTGALSEDRRFPGQWYQLEAGLHYNWHRHYDPTIGRYTQADPLGLVDGPSVYGYAKGHPVGYVDPDGRLVPLFLLGRCVLGGALAFSAATGGVRGAAGLTTLPRTTFFEDACPDKERIRFREVFKAEFRLGAGAAAVGCIAGIIGGPVNGQVFRKVIAATSISSSAVGVFAGTAIGLK